MTTRLNPKELLSWLILLFAILLFGTTVMYAQEGESNAKSKVSIQISREENGKISRLDTTFDINDEKAIEELIEKFTADADVNIDKNRKADKDRRIKIRAEVSSEKDGELKEMEKEINISLNEMEDKLRESLKGMEEFHFDFSSDFPDSVLLEFKFPDDAFRAGFNHDKGFFFGNDSVRWNAHCSQWKQTVLPDSLLSDEYIVLGGEEDEQTPIFEKEIVHSDGTKSFVFKRQRSESGAVKKNKKVNEKIDHSESLPGLTDLQIFPNPSSGNITISFNSLDNDKTDILILDSGGNSKLKISVKNEIGQFEKRFDLSKYGSGAYILKLTRKGKSISKKLIVE